MRPVYFLVYFTLLCCNVFSFTKAYADKSTKEFQETFLAKSCSLTTGQDWEGSTNSNLSSKYLRPMTSRVVECIDETMSNLFLKPRPSTELTLFQEFQVVLKPAVILALILYLIVNGYLIATGQMLKERPSQEIFLFIIKFILVFYFAVGDAWKDFFFIAIRSISSTFGSILVDAGSNSIYDGCVFNKSWANPYPPGKEYISMFDTLDCKIGNYIGWFADKKFPILIPVGVTMFFLGGVGQILFVLVFVLTIQLILIAARVTQLYLVSIMMLTILIYASPIIVPMVLFNQTKSIFDSWLGQILGLTIHPIVVFAFTGILLTVMDRIYYGPDPSQLFEVTGYVEEQDGLYSIDTSAFQGAGLDRQIDKDKFEQALIELQQKQIEIINTMYQSFASEVKNQTPPNIDDGSAFSSYNCEITQVKDPSKVESMKKLCNYLNKAGENLNKIRSDIEKIRSENNTLGIGLSDNTNPIVIAGLPSFLSPILGLSMLLPASAISTALNIMIPGIVGDKNYLKNPNGNSGATVKSNCYSELDFSAGLVCMMKHLDKNAVSVGLPIPYFIEILDVYIPYRPDIGFVFFVTVLLSVVLNLLIGSIFEKIESLIESISGVSVNSLGSYMGIVEGSMKAGRYGHSAMRDSQDKAFKRQSGAKSKEGNNSASNKDDNNSGSNQAGSSENNNSASSGNNENNNSASSDKAGSSENNNSASSGGGASSGASSASSGVSSAGEAASSGGG